MIKSITKWLIDKFRGWSQIDLMSVRAKMENAAKTDSIVWISDREQKALINNPWCK